MSVCPGFEGLKIRSIRKDRGREREFEFLEVIGTNLLANKMPLHFSNLIANGCCESANQAGFGKNH